MVKPLTVDLLQNYLVMTHTYTIHLQCQFIVMENNNESINNPTCMKPIEVSFEYMNQLSDYIIAGSSIVIQETVGQGMYHYSDY